MNKLILTAALMIIGSFLFAQKDSAILYFQKGMNEKGKGRRLESMKQLEKAYLFDPANKQVITELALSYFDLNRYGQSREKYQKLEQMGDNSPSTYKQLMLLSFNMRQLEDAIKYANLLKKADSVELVAFYIGKAYYEQERYANAIKYLETAAKEDPKKAEIPYMIARAYADLLNYKQAVPYFHKSISLDPSQSRWIYELALMYYGMNDDQNSIKYLLEAGEKGYKRDGEYLENLAIGYINTKQFSEGIIILKEALQHNPKDTNLLEMLAEAHYDSNKYLEAIGYWNQILSLEKNNANALFMSGMSYQKMGEKEKGMALCDKAVQMDPGLIKNKHRLILPGR